MGFSLAEAFVEIKANTRQSDAGIAATRQKLITLPGAKEIKIRVDATGVDAGIAAAKGKLATLDVGGLAAGVIGGLAAGAAGAAIPALVSGLRAGVMGASDLAETMSKVDVVFGAASGRVKGFAEGMQSAFGSGRTEILDAAAGFGLVGKAAGLAQGPAADLSVKLAGLADDASSFYNVPLADALLTIKSALVGESEPIRRFGVLLNEDAVKAEALRLGLSKVGKELTEGQKVMARASLIQKGMADAQGDHARTAGSFANQWREFTGRVYDLATSVGSVALPVLNTFLRVLNPIAVALQAIAAEIGKVIGGLGRLGNAVTGGAFEGLAGASPGGGAGKALPPSAAGGADAGAGTKYGLEAARKAVADDRAKADQDRLVTRVRDEAAAAEKLKTIDRQNAALHKHLWVEATAAELRAKTNVLELHGKGQVDDAFARARKDAEKLYTTKFGGKAAAEGASGKADSTAARNFIEKVASVGKEKLGQAFDFKADLQRRGLGVLAGAAGAVDAMGEPARRERERRQGFQAEFLSGEGLSQRMQGAALGDEARKEEKETAKNTAEAVFQLKALLDAFRGSAKQAGRSLATYG